MAVVRLEIKTRQPLADGRKFDHVGCYEQLDGTAHFAVDPAHRLNCAVTDIDLAMPEIDLDSIRAAPVAPRRPVTPSR